MALYEMNGFLDVTEPLLSSDEVRAARERVDNLFDCWAAIPRRLRGFDDGSRPLIARIFRVTALDRAIAQSGLLKTCRGIAASILGMQRVWCRFDSAIYKYPGAGPVGWHQDMALSTTGTPRQSVHFWIPLNDHGMTSGCMAHVPGSHRSGIATHRVAELSEGVYKSAELRCDEAVISPPLSVGNLSLHSPLTMHMSDPNSGEIVRKVMTLEFSSGPWSAVRQFGGPLVRAVPSPICHRRNR
jgi:hypothetical protein